jgi:excinuclease UvrABC nuclease subunit
MQWDPNEVVDSRVVSYSEWWINLKDFGELEPRAGVYLFANAKYDIKYVGTAGAGRMVEEIRDAINKKKSKGATKVRALYTNSNEKAQSLQEYLIEKYNPVNNRT